MRQKAQVEDQALNIIFEAFRILDNPIMVVNGKGAILMVSKSAELLIPSLAGFSKDQVLPDLISEHPKDFSKWLEDARFSKSINLIEEEGREGDTFIVRSHLLGEIPPLDNYWILNFMFEENFPSKKYEREILLRISSVPIPEMMDEGFPLLPSDPNKCPITTELLQLVLKFIRGRAVFLFRLEKHQSLSVIGQFGIQKEKLIPLLEMLNDPQQSEQMFKGIIGSAASSGFPYTIAKDNINDESLLRLVKIMPFDTKEIWLDGIGGFGTVLSLFSDSPKFSNRPFATDAFVRLGRHLESASYSNNMYEAYIELQKAQEQMIQSSKMAAIGELATGMAHELRQPVTVINNFFSTIFDHLELGRFEKIQGKVPEYKQRFNRNIDRLTRIIDHLRTFGRQESIQFKLTPLKSYLDEIFQTFLVGQLTKENINVRWEIPDDIPSVELDGSRIEQVILNLISNAKDALKGQTDPTITIHAEKNGDYLDLTISDNGHGIPEENLDKVLNPFFTTKPVGKGTGVGLSICHGIIEGHNGKIEIKNLHEGGASFTLKLPFKQLGTIEKTDLAVKSKKNMG